MGKRRLEGHKGILTAEWSNGAYLPLGCVGSLTELFRKAGEHLRSNLFPPDSFVLWKRGKFGFLIRACTYRPSEFAAA